MQSRSILRPIVKAVRCQTPVSKASVRTYLDGKTGGEMGEGRCSDKIHSSSRLTSFTDRTHVTDKTHVAKDVQSDASRSGKQSRAEDSSQSQATSERDTGDHNKRAEQDNKEAPKPVIGMNDERGGKGH